MSAFLWYTAAPAKLLLPATETAVLTGTAVGGITETDVAAGGRTVIVTLSGATWLA